MSSPKYKVYCKNEGFLLDVFSLFWDRDGSMTFKAESTTTGQCRQGKIGDDYILLEVTTSKDKNGTPICVGHILSRTNANDDKLMHFKVLKGNNGAFIIVPTTGRGHSYSLYEMIREFEDNGLNNPFEVVGNVFIKI